MKHAMPRQLTSDERVEVGLALKAETIAHRHWPKEVVAAFLAAEIVKRAEIEPLARRRLVLQPVTALFSFTVKTLSAIFLARPAL